MQELFYFQTNLEVVPFIDQLLTNLPLRHVAPPCFYSSLERTFCLFSCFFFAGSRRGVFIWLQSAASLLDATESDTLDL